VEVAFTADQVLVRRADEPDGPVLRFSHSAWGELIMAIRAGQFDQADPKPPAAAGVAILGAPG